MTVSSMHHSQPFLTRELSVCRKVADVRWHGQHNESNNHMPREKMLSPWEKMCVKCWCVALSNGAFTTEESHRVWKLPRRDSYWFQHCINIVVKAFRVQLLHFCSYKILLGKYLSLCPDLNDHFQGYMWLLALAASQDLDNWTDLHPLQHRYPCRLWLHSIHSLFFTLWTSTRKCKNLKTYYNNIIL